MFLQERAIVGILHFAHLASFQAIEFVDRPIPKTLHIFVCQTSENELSLQNEAFCNSFAKNENMI